MRRPRSSLPRRAPWMNRRPQCRPCHTEKDDRMHTTMVKAACIALAACLAPSGTALGSTDRLLGLQVGELRVLAVPDVARVAVGDGQIIKAITTEEKEVIVFARSEGSTVLQV